MEVRASANIASNINSTTSSFNYNQFWSGWGRYSHMGDNQDNTFTVFSAYKMCYNLQGKTKWQGWEDIWKAKVHQRARVFKWPLAHDMILSNHARWSRQIGAARIVGAVTQRKIVFISWGIVRPHLRFGIASSLLYSGSVSVVSLWGIGFCGIYMTAICTREMRTGNPSSWSHVGGCENCIMSSIFVTLLSR